MTSNYLERIALFYLTHMINMTNLGAIDVKTPMINSNAL